MTNPKYEHIGTPPIKLIEECSELIHAITKAERFGYNNHHPNYNENNITHIRNEWKDVLMKYAEFESWIKSNPKV